MWTFSRQGGFNEDAVTLTQGSLTHNTVPAALSADCVDIKHQVSLSGVLRWWIFLFGMSNIEHKEFKNVAWSYGHVLCSDVAVSKV